jgi:hypothetical protein
MENLYKKNNNIRKQQHKNNKIEKNDI